MAAKEKAIHEQGLVSVLRQLHDELDAAVADAYGWPVDLTDEEILARLVALNAERAAEEAQGHDPLAAAGIPGARNRRDVACNVLTIQEASQCHEARGAALLPWPTPWPSRPGRARRAG